MKAALATAVVALSAVACADKPRTAAEPTAPSAAIVPAETPQPTGLKGSTVCLSYGRDRELMRSKLKDRPNDEKLQKEFKALEDLILDAC